MAFDKPFLDIDKQLDLLESRNLIITNRDRAKRLIMTSSYYDLINGYKSVFMSSNDKFKSNVQLEDIYIFSFIDKGLQSVTMKYSLMIETLFKTRLSYVISNYLGVHQDDYLHARHYKRQIKQIIFVRSCSDNLTAYPLSFYYCLKTTLNTCVTNFSYIAHKLWWL